jgi:SAM-dependent methyltransferase
VDTTTISCCFDKESEKMLKDYRDNGLSDTSDAILGALGPSIKGSTVLELGCGVGALTVELKRRGASSATGMDLSPKMVELARTMAAEAGLSDSVTFEVGDGALAGLKKSDIVILDTVVCCYPDFAALVENSSSAAARYYAISAPDDTRPVTKMLKLLLPLQNIIVAVAGRAGFRFYLHPIGRIKKSLEEKGFTMTSKSKEGWIWSVFVFAAAASN